jgi:hypothetical protein
LRPNIIVLKIIEADNFSAITWRRAQAHRYIERPDSQDLPYIASLLDRAVKF